MDPAHKALERVWTPHPGQTAFLTSKNRFKVLACGRRWGKTDACAAEIVLTLLGDHASRWLVLAPTLDQARLLFERVLEMLGEIAGPSPPPKVRWTPYPRMEFGPHRLTARSGHVGRSLRGNEATHIVIDEAAFVPEELVTDVALPMLATTDGSITLISTPKGQNHFWRFFQMGERGENGVWSRKAPSSESPYVHPSFLDVQRQLVSERAFRVEYEAEFLDSEGRVFRTEAIERCLVPVLPRPADPPFLIGVDWARYGDFTAVVALCGDRSQSLLVEAQRIVGSAWNDQICSVARIVGRYPNPRVLCDATGIGDPLLEMLRTAVPNVRIDGYGFTAASKAQLIDNLAWLFESAGLSMTPNPELLRELEHFEAKSAVSGHRRLESVAGFHDDLVCAMALAAWMLPKAYQPQIRLGGPRRLQFSKP